MDAIPQQPANLDLPGISQLPEELRGPTPREVPEAVKQGRLAIQRRNILIGCLFGGGLCLVLEPMAFMKTLSLYILPLAYLNWIGIATCAIGVLLYMTAREYRKACRYIEQGEAGFGRVLQLVKTPTAFYEGQASSYALVAQVQAWHPQTGEACAREVRSRNFGSSQKDRIGTRFNVGDAVPIVWFPNQFDTTLQIYDFLEVAPETTLVRESSPTSPVQILLSCLAVFGIFFVLFWNVYALGRFEPLDFDFLQQGFWPLLIGAILGVGGFVAVYLLKARETQKVTERIAAAALAGQPLEVPVKKGRTGKVVIGLVLLAGAALLGALTVLCWAMSANAFLDTSLRQAVPVTITKKIQTTHKLMFREYTLKFCRIGEQKEHSLMTTPEHLDQFQFGAGTAQIRAGGFGWPWVETVDPAFVGVLRK